MSKQKTPLNRANEKPATTHPGTVQKVIKPAFPGEPEKAEIALDNADHLYREIRIENALTDPAGKEVALEPAAQVDVTISADPKVSVRVNTLLTH